MLPLVPLTVGPILCHSGWETESSRSCGGRDLPGHEKHRCDTDIAGLGVKEPATFEGAQILEKRPLEL